jgi:Arc/MetJ-type ribon-helix-helix transcriptional regulator
MIKEGGTRKVSITLPDDLIEQVHVYVKSGEFSSFCAIALRNHLAHYRQRNALANSFGIWKDENHPDLSSSKEVSGYVRNLRKTGTDRLSRLHKN